MWARGLISSQTASGIMNLGGSAACAVSASRSSVGTNETACVTELTTLETLDGCESLSGAKFYLLPMENSSLL